MLVLFFRFYAPYIERRKRDVEDFHQKDGYTLYLIEHIKKTPFLQEELSVETQETKKRVILKSSHDQKVSESVKVSSIEGIGQPSYSGPHVLILQRLDTPLFRD